MFVELSSRQLKKDFLENVREKNGKCEKKNLENVREKNGKCEKKLFCAKEVCEKNVFCAVGEWPKLIYEMRRSSSIEELISQYCSTISIAKHSMSTMKSHASRYNECPIETGINSSVCLEGGKVFLIPAFIFSPVLMEELVSDAVVLHRNLMRYQIVPAFIVM